MTHIDDVQKELRKRTLIGAFTLGALAGGVLLAGFIIYRTGTGEDGRRVAWDKYRDTYCGRIGDPVPDPKDKKVLLIGWQCADGKAYSVRQGYVPREFSPDDLARAEQAAQDEPAEADPKP